MEYGYPSKPEYWSAAVCRRGHTITSIIEYFNEEIPAKCSICGAEVLQVCTACEYRIKGSRSGDYYSEYKPPDFCDRCGEPHPWLSREGRIYLLQNILDHADVGEAERLRAHEQLEVLTDPDLGEEEQAERWARFRRAAPTVWAGEQAQKIIGSIIEAGTRAMIDKYM